jgi:hypothetical protein
LPLLVRDGVLEAILRQSIEEERGQLHGIVGGNLASRDDGAWRSTSVFVKLAAALSSGRLLTDSTDQLASDWRCRR